MSKLDELRNSRVRALFEKYEGKYEKKELQETEVFALESGQQGLLTGQSHQERGRG